MNRRTHRAAVSFVAALLATLFVQAFFATPSPSATSSEPATPEFAGGGHVVRVYYFHTTQRCSSCRKIEALADEAIQSGFGREIAGGKLEWVVVNLDEARNRHFVSDYKLYTKSLVVVDLADGGQTRWKNLEKIWELLRDEAAFRKYVQDQVREYLEERS